MFPQKFEFRHAGHRWRASYDPIGAIARGRYVPDQVPPASWVLECAETGEVVAGPVRRDELITLTEARLRLALNRHAELRLVRERASWRDALSTRPEGMSRPVGSISRSEPNR